MANERVYGTNGPNAGGYTEYDAKGTAVAWGVDNNYVPTASPAPSPKVGNSIGTGLTPTGGASTVASSGLGGGSAPQVTTPAAPPKAQTPPNAYYTPGDAQTAQQLSPYYNLVPYGRQMLGEADIAVGGNGVIPDSALANPNQRLGGLDSAGTAAQVSNYLKNISAMTPEQFQTMNSEQLTGSIQGASQAVTTTIGQIQSLIDMAVSDKGANVAPILSGYMDRMDTFFTEFLTNAQSAYDNGMNDPGLLQAVSLIADQASTMKNQLNETMNARGLSQSGVWINASNDADKATQQAEATLIGTHLSNLTANLQASMTSVLNQRVAALTAFGGIEASAAIENSKSHIAALTAAISGISNIAQIQQADVNSQRDNATSRANTAATNAQSNVESIRNTEVRREELVATVNQYAETNKLDAQELNELVRSHKASEAIQMIAANAQARSAEASYLNAKNSGGLTPAQVLAANNVAVEHSDWVATKLMGVQQAMEDGKITGQEILNNGEQHYRALYDIPKENNRINRDYDSENLQLRILFDSAEQDVLTKLSTSTKPWLLKTANVSDPYGGSLVPTGSGPANYPTVMP